MTERPKYTSDFNWSEAEAARMVEIERSKLVPVLTLEQAIERAGQWLKTDIVLPPFRTFVLGRYTGGNWIFDDDQDGVNHVVCWRTEADPNEFNNRRCYYWQKWGPGSHFGQRICAWMYFPRYVRHEKTI